MAIESVVPPQYPAPISTPGLPVGGIVDPNTGNAQAQVLDSTVRQQLAAVIVLLNNLLVEQQILNEQMFPRVNFDAERQGRYS